MESQVPAWWKFSQASQILQFRIHSYICDRGYIQRLYMSCTYLARGRTNIHSYWRSKHMPCSSILKELWKIQVLLLFQFKIHLQHLLLLQVWEPSRRGSPQAGEASKNHQSHVVWPGCHKDFESLDPLHTSVQGVREIEGLACTVFECSWCSQIQGKAQERTDQAHELGPKDALQQSKSRRIIWRSEDAAVSRFQLWKKWNEIRREWVWIMSTYVCTAILTHPLIVKQ